MIKDYAVFREGKVRGELRYPPFEEEGHSDLVAIHRQFKLNPQLGCIGHYPRHIPYNSDKKSFQEKTGRESFEGMCEPFGFGI